jgi:predicted nuclease with RNAse H fold
MGKIGYALLPRRWIGLPPLTERGIEIIVNCLGDIGNCF